MVWAAITNIQNDSFTHKNGSYGVLVSVDSACAAASVIPEAWAVGALSETLFRESQPLVAAVRSIPEKKATMINPTA